MSLKLLSLVVGCISASTGFSCNGNFDVTFLLDRSSSMGSNYQTHVIPFAKSVASQFVGDRVRAAAISFGSTADIIQAPTSDPVELTSSLDAALFDARNQGTNIGAALELVSMDDRETNRIVFIVSDGCDSEWRDQKGRYIPEQTLLVANSLKSRGVEIYIVYIPLGSLGCPDYLKRIASQPTQDRFFPILTKVQDREQYFDQLNTPEFIDNLILNSCFQIDYVTPTNVCNSALRTLEVFGKGFTAVTDLAKLQCKFDQIIPACKDDPPDPYTPNDCPQWQSKGYCEDTEYVPFMNAHCPVSCGICSEPLRFVEDAVVVSDTELVCRSPRLGAIANFQFEITRNSITYTQSNVNIETYDCNGEEQDDPTPFDYAAHLSLAIVSNPSYFTSATEAVVVDFIVSNDGKVGITGPLIIEIVDLPILNCPPGNLGVGEQMTCTSTFAVTTQHRIDTKMIVQAVAKGTFDGKDVKATLSELTVHNRIVPTPNPSASPTNSPTLAPTSEPTPMPTVRPTPVANCASINHGVIADASFDSPSIPEATIFHSGSYSSPLAGKIGSGLDLPGVSEFAELPAVTISDTSFTIHVSFKATSIRKSYIYESGPAGSFSMLTIDETGVLNYWVTTQGTGCAASTSTVVESNSWYDVVVTFAQENECRIYVNGVEDKSSLRLTTGRLIDIDAIYLGARVWGDSILYHSEYLDGAIDSFVVWNRALGPQEVEYLFNVGDQCLRTKSYVFMTEAGATQEMSRQSTQSGQPKELVLSGLAGVLKSAVDADNGIIFFLEDASKGKRIRRESTTGGDSAVIVKSSDVSNPVDLCFDSEQFTIFIADSGLGALLMAKYDGHNLVVVADGYAAISGIVFDRSSATVYVADGGSIFAVSDLTSNKMGTVLQATSSSIASLAVANGNLFWISVFSSQTAKSSSTGRRLARTTRSLSQEAASVVFSAAAGKAAPVSTVTLSGVMDAKQIEVDGKEAKMYLLTESKVVKANLDGSQLEDFAFGLDSPVDISVVQIATKPVPPSPAPTALPTLLPTSSPSEVPTSTPSLSPTNLPSVSPSEFPTALPTVAPTETPSFSPTFAPSFAPTRERDTSNPTALPTEAPTSLPTSLPSVSPTAAPTLAPTAMPTAIPSAVPTMDPSVTPTAVPSAKPTFKPTQEPSQSPSFSPTSDPTSASEFIPELAPESEEQISSIDDTAAQACPEWFWPIECIPWYVFAGAGGTLLLLLVCCICCLRSGRKHKAKTADARAEPNQVEEEEEESTQSNQVKVQVEEPQAALMGELAAKLAGSRRNSAAVDSSESDDENNNYVQFNYGTLKKGEFEQLNRDGMYLER